MKHLFLIVVLFSIVSCSKPGSINGNVFWKYNDYVGNKPDSGATITIYSLDENPKDSVYTTTTDINGNYKIENIAPGEYFFVANSKNTKSSPINHLENLKKHSGEIKKLFNFNIESYTLDNLKNLILLNSLNVGDPEHVQTEKELNDKIAEIIQSFPNHLKSKVGLDTGFDNSITFKKIKVIKDRANVENIDFGTSYY